MKYNSCFILASIVMAAALSSCATASLSKYKAVGRVKTYHIHHKDIPHRFDGFKMAFVTDFHYESRFNSKRLPALIKTLQSIDADVLLLGGDYKGYKGGDMEMLFSELSRVETKFGSYAVMGNHERSNDYVIVRKAMERYGVKLLEHNVDTLSVNEEFILVCGIRNPFDLAANGLSPTLTLSDSDYVVMLTHTPDYAEDVDISHTDIVLSGHTHGGQVSLFGRWTPVRFSKYRNKFLTGLKKTSAGIPVIISNGVGTSRRNIRLFTPSEVVVVELHTEKP